LGLTVNKVTRDLLVLADSDGVLAGFLAVYGGEAGVVDIKKLKIFKRPLTVLLVKKIANSYTQPLASR
jgi:hypothetical protein